MENREDLENHSVRRDRVVSEAWQQVDARSKPLSILATVVLTDTLLSTLYIEVPCVFDGLHEPLHQE